MPRHPRPQTIKEWVDANGRGALQELIDKCDGVGRMTVRKAAKGEGVYSGEAAIKLSDATGGVVTVRRVIRPDGS